MLPMMAPVQGKIDRFNDWLNSSGKVIPRASCAQTAEPLRRKFHVGVTIVRVRLLLRVEPSTGMAPKVMGFELPITSKGVGPQGPEQPLTCRLRLCNV
jgi:hypothetical protein